jgi:prolyl 4-hydroxylase
MLDEKLYQQMNLSDYVRVYDDILDRQDCADLIDLFESEKDKQVVRDDLVMNFTEINVVQAGWMLEPLIRPALIARQQYWKDCNINNLMIQPDHAWEEMRMKRYLPDGQQQFHPHNDTWNATNCKRFLVYFWYLNDVAEGGETVFYRLDREVKVKPVAGRLIMFPVTWQYLHAGLAPISNAKYILGGYLHYT